MQTALIGFGGLALAGGAACLLWMRLGAPRGPARMARRVEAELRALGLDEPAQPRT